MADFRRGFIKGIGYFSLIAMTDQQILCLNTEKSTWKENEVNWYWQQDWSSLLRGDESGHYSGILSKYLGLHCHMHVSGKVTAVARELWQNQWVRDRLWCPIQLDGNLVCLYWLPFTYDDYTCSFLYKEKEVDGLWVSWSFFSEVYELMWAYHCGVAMGSVRGEHTRYAQEASMKPFLEKMIQGAYARQATDIHFSYNQDQGTIFFRIQGDLVAYETLSRNMAEHLSACLKVSSGLDLNLGSQAQEARLTLNGVSLRMSILPSLEGESVALRLPSPHAKVFWDSSQKKKVLEALSYSSGLILVIGPTGSGKSTTLYHMLSLIDITSRRVMSLEDPIERPLECVRQIEVNTKQGFDFATALPALLRQDPDVILVGEIRDKKTAAICVQASMTGHLVLSSMHAATCDEAFLRLHHLVEDSFLSKQLEIGVRLMVNQRLIPVSGEKSDETKQGSNRYEALWVIAKNGCLDEEDRAVFLRQAQPLLESQQTTIEQIEAKLGPFLA